MPPSSIDDPELGRIKWSKRASEWTFHVDAVDVKSIECRVVQEESTFPPPPEILATVRRTTRWLLANESGVRDFIVSEMLDTAHDWADDREPPLTRESFKSRLRFGGVNFFEDLTANVFYGDDGIFAGHSVVVLISPNLEFDGTPALFG